MELDSALRHVEFAGDFLVGKILEHAVQHFPLAAADLYFRSDGASGSEKLFGPLGYRVQEGFSCDDHDLEILGRLATHQAMHRQQAGNLLDRDPAIGIRLHAESHCS